MMCYAYQRPGDARCAFSSLGLVSLGLVLEAALLPPAPSLLPSLLPTTNSVNTGVAFLKDMAMLLVVINLVNKTMHHLLGPTETQILSRPKS